jgi:hypothetical protein
MPRASAPNVADQDTHASSSSLQIDNRSRIPDMLGLGDRDCLTAREIATKVIIIRSK